MLGHPVAVNPNVFQCEEDLVVLFLHHAHQQQLSCKKYFNAYYCDIIVAGHRSNFLSVWALETRNICLLKGKMLCWVLRFKEKTLEHKFCV